MSKSTSINWKEAADELERAPDNFLQDASKLWRSKLSEKRLHQSQKSKQDVLGDNTRKDAQQQARWKKAHNSATEELLYFGEFADKNEHIRLLQRVKVVNRTAKQIHIVAAYTLYYSTMRHGNEPVAWSARPDGDLFGNFYTDWIPVIRYRLRQISRTRLYEPSALNIPQTGGSNQEQDARIQGWKHLSSICLFSNESEYAEWHLARYEDTVEKAETSNVNPYSSNRSVAASYVLLGLSISASQTEIKAAYKRMAMKHHPDRGGSATEFHNVKTAYDSLNGNRDNTNTRC
jgi:hypothetical protein